MHHFGLTISKIAEEVFLPLLVVAVVLTILRLFWCKPKRREIVALLLMIICAFGLRFFVHGLSSRYTLIFSAATLLAIGLGLEEIFRRSAKLGYCTAGAILLILVARSAVFFLHPPYLTTTGNAIRCDAKKYSHAVIISEKRNDAARLTYYAENENVYSFPEKKSWEKSIWNAHYLAPVVYYVGTGLAPFPETRVFSIPGLQTKQEAKLVFHAYKNYHKKKEFYVYRQEIKEDIFLPVKKEALLSNGDFKAGFQHISQQNENFHVDMPKCWGMSPLHLIDQDKPLVIQSVTDKEGTVQLEITMLPQSGLNSLGIFSPDFTPSEKTWIAFDATLSADAQMKVRFGVYDEKGNGLGEETALCLDGKYNQGKRSYQIPLDPKLWELQGKSKRLFFSIRQGKICLSNIRILEY